MAGLAFIDGISLCRCPMVNCINLCTRDIINSIHPVLAFLPSLPHLHHSVLYSSPLVPPPQTHGGEAPRKDGVEGSGEAHHALEDPPWRQRDDHQRQGQGGVRAHQAGHSVAKSRHRRGQELGWLQVGSFGVIQNGRLDGVSSMDLIYGALFTSEILWRCRETAWRSIPRRTRGPDFHDRCSLLPRCLTCCKREWVLMQERYQLLAFS